MYNQGLGMLDRVTTDLNHAHMASIRAEVKLQNQIPGVNYFNKLKEAVLILLKRPVTVPKLVTVSLSYFNEDDCQKSASPCS